MTDRWSRWAPLTSVLFVALLATSLAINFNTPNSDATGQHVISYFTAHRSRVMTSAFLGGFAAIFFLYFAASLRAYLRRTVAAEGLAGLGFGGAILVVVGASTFSALSLALADVPSKLDPSSAQALNVLSNDFFFAFAIGTNAFLIGNGLVIIRTGALPKWLGWVAFVLGVIAFTPAGFFAFFGVMAWTLIVGGVMYVRSGSSTPSTPAVESRGAGSPLAAE